MAISFLNKKKLVVFMHKKKFLRRVLHGMHTAVSIHLC